MLAVAGTFSPTSVLFQVNNVGIKILLFALAIGIAFGLLRRPFFRARPNLSTDTSVQRHSSGNLLLHWVNAAAFLLAIYTAAVLLRWIGDPLQLSTVYILHYVAGGLILFAAGAVAMNALTYGTTSRHRLLPTGADMREFGSELLGYIGLRGNQGFLGFFPNQKKRESVTSSGDKYLATERVMSYPLWVVILTVLFITGTIKGLRYLYPIPNSWLSVVTPVHDIAAYATVVMLVFHAGAVLVIKTNWPLLRSMFTTREDMAYARQHNPKWLEEVAKAADEAPKQPVTPAPGSLAPTHGSAGGSD
ncbi:MAG TPA: cytochrome b/b6 domain-containing protein [Bacillota bacterium]|nr:cytochrome b/b6 domain-containing protein [Bacillota bacterium]